MRSASSTTASSPTASATTSSATTAGRTTVGQPSGGVVRLTGRLEATVAANLRLVLVDVPPPVRRVLLVTRLDRVLTLRHSDSPG